MSEDIKVEEKQEEVEAPPPPILDDAAEAPKEEAKPVEEAKVEEPAKEAGPSVEDLQKQLEAAQADAANAKAALEAASKEKAPEARVETPEDIYLKEFNERPSEAVLNLVKRREQEKYRKEEMAYTQAVLAEAQKGKIAGWEDFPKLMGAFPAIVQKYGAIVNPEKENSVLTLEALTLIARGLMASQQGASQTDHENKDLAKERAMMEGADSSGNGADEDFAALSLEEMRKRIPAQVF